MKTFRFALVIAATLVLASCRTGAPRSDSRVTVTASFYPLAEFSERVGGDRTDVLTLVPSGVEPHDFEPTPRELAVLTRARVVVYNGAGFEPWLERLLPELQAGAVVVKTTEGLPLRGGDPHVWLDPVLAQEQVAHIQQGLIRADPAGRSTYERNGKALRRDLQNLHERFSRVLAQCRRREVVTSHEAFGYLAERYGLTEIPISGLDPEAEPTPARLADLIKTIGRHNAKVVYAETLVSSRVAEVIAREVGASVRTLNPVEGLTPEEQRAGKNYFTVMRENLDQLAEGLDCR